MARIRQIKPEFFLDEDLALLDFGCRLLFEGLWVIADRAGRLEDRPLRIKAQVLPHDNVDVNSMLQKLADSGFILRYEVDGRKYIQVRTFDKHQHCHVKEPESTIPAPVKHRTRTRQEPGKNDAKPPESGTRNLDNGILEPPLPPCAADAAPVAGMCVAFEDFYREFPRKVGKIEAERAWKKAVKRAPPGLIVDRLKLQVSKGVFDKEARYLPYPARWLNGGRWDDEIINPNGHNPHSQVGAAEAWPEPKPPAETVKFHLHTQLSADEFWAKMREKFGPDCRDQHDFFVPISDPIRRAAHLIFELPNEYFKSWWEQNIERILAKNPAENPLESAPA